MTETAVCESINLNDGDRVETYTCEWKTRHFPVITTCAVSLPKVYFPQGSSSLWDQNMEKLQADYFGDGLFVFRISHPDPIPRLVDTGNNMKWRLDSACAYAIMEKKYRASSGPIEIPPTFVPTIIDGLDTSSAWKLGQTKAIHVKLDLVEMRNWMCDKLQLSFKIVGKPQKEDSHLLNSVERSRVCKRNPEGLNIKSWLKGFKIY